MTTRRVAGALTRRLLALQQRWLALSGKEQDELYAREVAPAFAPLFAELPQHGAPAGFERPGALVIVLGFSWQPVASMAAWARPERMLAIGTKESLAVSWTGKGAQGGAGMAREALRRHPSCRISSTVVFIRSAP